MSFVIHASPDNRENVDALISGTFDNVLLINFIYFSGKENRQVSYKKNKWCSTKRWLKENDYNPKEHRNTRSTNPKRNTNISNGIEKTCCNNYVFLCLENSNICVSLRPLLYHAVVSSKTKTGSPLVVSRIDITVIWTSKTRVTNY